MEKKIFEKNNQIIYMLIGKVCTLRDYQELRDIVENVRHKNKPVVIDLTKITFISSQGLGTLISISQSLKKFGINLILFNPRGEIKEEIELAGIDMIIPIACTEEDLKQMIHLKT